MQSIRHAFKFTFDEMGRSEGCISLHRNRVGNQATRQNHQASTL